jgi:hypothetical protein
MPEQSAARLAPITPDPNVMDRIRSEEIYREQVRQSLQPPPAVRSRIMGFLNSSFGIFCLSSIIVAGFTTIYTRYTEGRQARSANEELVRKLDAEISYRISELRLLRTNIFPFDDLHTARAAVTGRTRSIADVGVLGNFDPIFPEFGGRSLYALLWQLQRLLPSPSPVAFPDALAASRDLADLIDDAHLTLVKPRGEDSSTWTMSPAQRQRYTKDMAGLDVERWR